MTGLQASQLSTGPTDRAEAWFSDAIYLFKRVREDISASQITSKFSICQMEPYWRRRLAIWDRGTTLYPTSSLPYWWHLSGAIFLRPSKSKKTLNPERFNDAGSYLCLQCSRGLYELDFQRKGFLMKTNFLHGLADVLSWQGVQFALSPCTPKLFDISPIQKLSELKKGWWSASSKKANPFILVGLSLGGVLALDLSRQDFLQLKGLVLQELNTNQHQPPSV